VSPVDHALRVEADRQMPPSALANRLQNAFKFARPYGHVSRCAHAAADRMLIDFETNAAGNRRM